MTAETSVQRSFARVVFALDSRLRRRYGVFDYLDSPDCILRMRVGRVGRRIVLSDGVRLEPADRIAELHFRNEHFPAMHQGGATIAWARRVAQRMDLSLRELCRYLESRSELDDVAAIRAVMPLRNFDQAPQFERIASRFGFAPSPEPDTVTGQLLGFGQNLVGLTLVMASNPQAAHLDLLLRRAAPVYISRCALEKRYREPDAPDVLA